MANLTQFINTWTGKTLDFDGAFGPQCVDLAKKWNQELGYSPRYGNGNQWINNAGADYTRINYTPGALPKEGDIVSWAGQGPANVPYGHVAVATGKGDSKTFQTFDQNWGGVVCKLNNHSYQAVQGWIRPKNYQTGGETMINDLDNEYNRWEKLGNQVRGRHLTRDEFRAAAVGKTWLRAIEILSDDPEADNAQVSQNVGGQAQREDWSGQITSLRSQVTSQTTQITELTTNATNLNDQIVVLTNEVASLREQLAAGELIVPKPSQPLRDFSFGELIRAIIAKVTGGDN